MCVFLFLYDLIIKIVKNHGRSGKLRTKREFCQLIMFAIWYLSRFGNLFIQSAAKCTCTNFILQKSETFLCQSLGNHWKTFPQQRRENRWQLSNYGNDLACHFFKTFHSSCTRLHFNDNWEWFSFLEPELLFTN
jgi:hypothetical protein